MRRGYLKTCQENENMCFSEVRNVEGFFMVTKRCKQSNACQNNYVQNPRGASIIAQCNPRMKSSVCRCCCGTDSCNRRGLSCLDSRPTCSHVPRPANGFTRCLFSQSATEIGSVCSFSCNKGYRLVGSDRSTCVNVPDEYPSFDKPAPVCQPIQCPAIESIANGRTSCSGGSAVKSMCSFECDDGFELVGAKSLACEPRGEWSGPVPHCQALLCARQFAPMHGSVSCDTSDGEYRVGTQRQFACYEGYALLGAEVNTCEQQGPGYATWSEEAPTCEPIVCIPPHENPENGMVICEHPATGPVFGDEMRLGTVCTFYCEDGFELLGSGTSECLKDVGPVGAWSSEAPICQATQADMPELVCPEPVLELANGDVLCDFEDGRLGSECLFLCDEGYGLFGEDSTTCLATGEWSNPHPRCVELNCGVQSPILNGTMHCTRADEVSSRCTFGCDAGTSLVLAPEGVTQNECVLRRDGTTGWFPPQPCCSKPCPPYILMDFVIVLDSSSSVRIENWNKQHSFTRSLIQMFSFGETAARMAVFRYNNRIDEDSEVRLNDVIDGDMDRFVSKFDQIPYNGRGTKTGEALLHVQRKALSAEYGNRPGIKDVVLVVTDGKANDQELVSQVSRELREKGVLIYAVGIGLKGYAFQKLVEMTGREDRTINAINFDVLLEEGGLIEQLGSSLCSDPCGNLN